MGSEGEIEVAENKRARVRRLLIEPLEALGMRRGAKMPADVFKTKMNSMIDALTYMSDQRLAVLFEMLKTKGEGRSHDLWPSPATILGIAEFVQPRPIQELPNLLSWFRSVEGPKCLEAGTLVETWQYFQRNKRPPIHAKQQIEVSAKRHQHRCQLTRERMGRGTADPDDIRWLQRYEQRQAYCRTIVLGDDEKGRA